MIDVGERMEPSSLVWVGITLRSNSMAESPAGAGGGCPLRSFAQGHIPAQPCFLPIPVLLAPIIYWFLLGGLS